MAAVKIIKADFDKEEKVNMNDLLKVILKIGVSQDQITLLFKNKNATILNVKEAIFKDESTSTPINQQRLVFDGKVLDDATPVNTLKNPREDAVVFLALPRIPPNEDIGKQKYLKYKAKYLRLKYNM